ncbi:MAG: hypothetical protein KKE02_24685 [Alphaproteobacteria bacterium]|nr:hypothetical protein [Alphaproteobacteria bacterium]MBU1517273.1 hypothetical protein [Alphaproteobacteria bacterium]MBU2093191.1 hypothetical protein [Alphaproteobacteria bacterium]MBU2154238.1 hypothetical protein [Alphaproteobacteria bacterium]MBU2305869.1 hypothetical protein [Alphaproteobacteria bacterium]
MRSSFTATTGLKLSRSPSVRDQTARRRLVVGAAVLALAGVGLGLVTAPQGERAARTSPFSYFPSE